MWRILATFGAGFIEGPPHLSWGLGEILTIKSTICPAYYIYTKNNPASRSNRSVYSLLFRSHNLLGIDDILLGIIEEILRLGVLSNGVLVPVLLLGLGGTFFCLLLLNLFQRYLHPVQAAIIYALEPVWATTIALALEWYTGMCG